MPVDPWFQHVPAGLGRRVAGLLRRRGLADAAVLLSGLLVGLALGQLAGFLRLGETRVLLPALAVVVLATAVAIGLGIRATGGRRTPYW